MARLHVIIAINDYAHNLQKFDEDITYMWH